MDSDGAITLPQPSKEGTIYNVAIPLPALPTPGLQVAVPDRQAPALPTPGLQVAVPDRQAPALPTPGLQVAVPDRQAPALPTPGLQVAVPNRQTPAWPTPGLQVAVPRPEEVPDRQPSAMRGILNSCTFHGCTINFQLKSDER